MPRRTTKAPASGGGTRKPPILLPVFAHDHYRAYLKAVIAANPERRGFRSHLAEAAGCTPSYLSQVLSDQAGLSLDQLHRLAHFLDIGEDEWSYLRELVIAEKCATEPTRSDALRRAESVRARVGGQFVQSTPSVAVDAAHLAPTLFSLVHWDIFHLLGAPSHSRPRELAARLGVTLDVVTRALEDWRRAGLVEARDDGRWVCRGVRFSSQSIMRATTGHMYRMRAAVRAFEGRGEPPRFAAIRLTKANVEKLRARVEALFEEAWRLAAASEADGDEALFLAVDCDVI